MMRQWRNRTLFNVMIGCSVTMLLVFGGCDDDTNERGGGRTPTPSTEDGDATGGGTPTDTGSGGTVDTGSGTVNPGGTTGSCSHITTDCWTAGTGCFTCAIGSEFDESAPCKPQADACWNSTDCVQVNDCQQNCAGADWENCYNGCMAANSTGANLFAAMRDCAMRECAHICP